MSHPGIYHLDNGLMGYGAGLGRLDAPGEDGDVCLIIAVERDEDGGMWAHILRMRDVQRVPCSHVVHFKTPLGAGTN